MPRRITVSVKEINKLRASNWEWHYRNRGWAKMFSSEDAQRITRVLIRDVPPPVLMLDGDVLDGMATLLGQKSALQYLGLIGDRRSMCVWYWSEDGWMDFVREFQSLPEVYEAHYWAYDAGLDAVRLLPVSGKPFRVQVGGNSGGTGVQVGGNSGGTGRKARVFRALS